LKEKDGYFQVVGVFHGSGRIEWLGEEETWTETNLFARRKFGGSWAQFRAIALFLKSAVWTLQAVERKPYFDRDVGEVEQSVCGDGIFV
jgi:hypothetical protein